MRDRSGAAVDDPGRCHVEKVAQVWQPPRGIEGGRDHFAGCSRGRGIVGPVRTSGSIGGEKTMNLATRISALERCGPNPDTESTWTLEVQLLGFWDRWEKVNSIWIEREPPEMTFENLQAYFLLLERYRGHNRGL